jgi:hypothetical protein
MDDNVIVFVITMKVFAIVIVYSITRTKKHRPHMANFVISIGLFIEVTYEIRVFLKGAQKEVFSSILKKSL